MTKLGDAARGPVSTYADAKAWLVTYSNIEDWLYGEPADLPKEAKLVADMFWIGQADLIRDLRALWSDALDGRSPPPPLRHTHRSGGWR